MPRVSVVQPQVLLAPTANENPLISSNSEVETMTKDAEVQTMYRENEASLLLRKKLMEHQEVREFHLREAEIDIRRENKVKELASALEAREEIYAPVQREGKEIARPSENFSVASRTMPLDNIGNILSLEYTISKRYLDHSS
eukprot:gene37416-46159_t